MLEKLFLPLSSFLGGLLGTNGVGEGHQSLSCACPLELISFSDLLDFSVNVFCPEESAYSYLNIPERTEEKMEKQMDEDVMLVVCERYRTERKRWTGPVRGGFGRVRAGQDLSPLPAFPPAHGSDSQYYRT